MPTSRSEGFPLESALTIERSALGATILDASGHQAGVLLAQTSEQDFRGSLHRAVYRAIRALVGRNEMPLEYNSIISEMQAQGTFESYAYAYTLVSSLGEGVVLAIPMSTRTRALRRRQKPEAVVV